MNDLKANKEVSNFFPRMPSILIVASCDSGSARKAIAENDGSVFEIEGEKRRIGSWWPLSARAIDLRIDGFPRFFRFEGSGFWISHKRDYFMTWSGKRGRELRNLRIRPPSGTGNEFNGSRSGNFQNISRFRMGVLPIDSLDQWHRDQLHCMGLRVCYHFDVGRVLISTRAWNQGETVIYSKVRSFSVETDDQVLDLVDSKDPSSCYLLVPRSKTLYYNKGTFSFQDPIHSGDLWFLVNHSPRPNLEIVLRKHGIQFKAKRSIQPHEPLVWSYPSSFFGKDDNAVDLPQYIIPEDSVHIGE